MIRPYQPPPPPPPTAPAGESLAVPAIEPGVVAELAIALEKAAPKATGKGKHRKSTVPYIPVG